MKKLTVMTMIAAMSLSCLMGCGGSADTAKESTDTKEAVSVETTETGAAEEAAPEEEKKEEEAPVAEEIALADVVLVDNEEMKVVAKKVTLYDGSHKKAKSSKYNTVIDVTVENKTDAEWIEVGDGSVNSLKCSAIWQYDEDNSGNVLEVAKGETVDAKIEMYDSAIRKQKGKATDIVVSFESVADDGTVFTAEHIYPFGEENAVKYSYELQETDTVLMDNESVRVILTECFRYTEENYISMEYVVENKTDGAILFTYNNITADGTPLVYDFTDDIIAAGIVDETDVYIDSVMLEDAGISFKDLKELAFTAWIFDADDFTWQTVSDMRWTWIMEGRTDSFNPDNYVLVSEEVTLPITDFNYEE